MEVSRAQCAALPPVVVEVLQQEGLSSAANYIANQHYLDAIPIESDEAPFENPRCNDNNVNVSNGYGDGDNNEMGNLNAYSHPPPYED